MTPFDLRKKILFSFVFIFCIWIFGLLWFYKQVPQNQIPTIENSADAIIVLTGGSGRLEYGLELLAENKAKILFISGTGENVKPSDILRQTTAENRKKIKANNIILGHQAENTIGNAQEIKQWLEKSEYKTVILVTSNYHIPRSVLELSTLLPQLSIISAPVITSDMEMIFSEYNKYLASKLRHFFISTIEKK